MTKKVKIFNELHIVQKEQVSKLNSKHQAETDLLEDIREFAKQRAAIEKTYASSLYKLGTQFLQKREFPAPPEAAQSEESPNKTAHQVWKLLLEETLKMAQSRLTSAESVTVQVADNIKTQKNFRAQTLKKCDELAKAWHEEIQGTVRNLTRAKKNYAEAEHAAQDARTKSDEATDRFKKGTLKLFQSRNTLEKQCTRLNAKRSVCDKRSNHLRNAYLFTLAAANAHQRRLFEVDIPHLMEILDADTYQRINKYLLTFCTAEIESSTFARSCSEKILANAEKVNKDYHKECFLKTSFVLTHTLQYHYDPVPHDEVSSLQSEDATELLYLEREARKWATDVAKMSKVIENVSKQMSDCQSQTTQLKGSDASSDSGFSQDKDPEVALETLREYLRKAETTKLKADSKLEVLKSAGIEVDEWIKSAFEAIAKEAEIEAQMNPHNAKEEENITMESYDASFDTAEVLDATNYQDMNVSAVTSSSLYQPGVLHCVALYEYKAQREDELDILEGEHLQIMEESEGDGWIKAKNENDVSGYIPENYVKMEQPRRLSTNLFIPPSFDVGSPDYSQGSSNSLTDNEVQAVMMNGAVSGVPGIGNVRALYDFTGSSAEELTFCEGTIFKLLRREENGVEDGFWQGELDGKIGVFPSLLVEEISEDGSMHGSEEDIEEEDTPAPDFAPPDFAPPDYAPPPLPIIPDINFQGMDEHEPINRRASYGEYGNAEEFDFSQLQPLSPGPSRSAPQSPLSSAVRPTRLAPAPPKAKPRTFSDFD